MHIEVPRLDKTALDANSPKGESSASIRSRVVDAYERQLQRSGKSNAELTASEVEKFCSIKAAERQLLEQAMDRLKLSARAYHRILKLARTIADIAASDNIEVPHITEAISYRSIDRLSS